MKKLSLLSIFLVLTHLNHSQNLIRNPDFELYSSCPVAISEVTKANFWYSAIENSDYFNCSFTGIPSIINTTTAYSGSGFMGFLSNGDLNGSAEAIGQHLIQPLIPNLRYSITFAAKRTDQGPYATNCGGIEVYGFKDSVPTPTALIHASQLPNALLLGSTSTIQDTIWNAHAWDFKVTDTVNYIVFTISKSPSCLEYAFIDSTSIIPLETTSTSEESVFGNFGIYPNPSAGHITVRFPDDNLVVVITDVLGKVVTTGQLRQSTVQFNLDHGGIYFVSIKTDHGVFARRVLVGQ